MQAGTGSGLEQSVAAAHLGQNVHSTARWHQVDLQQGNSDVWLQLAQLGLL